MVPRGAAQHPHHSKAFPKALTSALVFIGVLRKLTRAPESQTAFCRDVPGRSARVAGRGGDGTKGGRVSAPLRWRSEAFPTGNASLSTARERRLRLWSVARQEKPPEERVPWAGAHSSIPGVFRFAFPARRAPGRCRDGGAAAGRGARSPAGTELGSELAAAGVSVSPSGPLLTASLLPPAWPRRCLDFPAAPRRSLALLAARSGKGSARPRLWQWHTRGAAQEPRGGEGHGAGQGCLLGVFAQLRGAAGGLSPAQGQGWGWLPVLPGSSSSRAQLS